MLNLVDSVIREQGGLPCPEERRGAHWWWWTRCSPCPEWTTSRCCQRAGQVRRQLHPGHPEPGQAGRPLSHHAGHHPGQRGLPGRVPGGGQRRPATGVGAGQGAGVTEDDITSLDVHHCYVRATVGTERMPAFSMMVRRPEPGDADIAARIRAAIRGLHRCGPPGGLRRRQTAIGRLRNTGRASRTWETRAGKAAKSR